jgi:hypothetical protein
MAGHDCTAHEKARSESERKGKELREKPIRGFSRFQSEVFQNFFEVLKNLLRLSKTLFRQPERRLSQREAAL